MVPELSGGRRGRVAVIVAPVATLIACLVLFFNVVRCPARCVPLTLPHCQQLSCWIILFGSALSCDAAASRRTHEHIQSLASPAQPTCMPRTFRHMAETTPSRRHRSCADARALMPADTGLRGRLPRQPAAASDQRRESTAPRPPDRPAMSVFGTTHPFDSCNSTGSTRRRTQCGVLVQFCCLILLTIFHSPLLRR